LEGGKNSLQHKRGKKEKKVIAKKGGCERPPFKMGDARGPQRGGPEKKVETWGTFNRGEKGGTVT